MEDKILLKVSIVMPSLNQVQFIEPAVTSVLDQDYSAVELVIADGGSADGTIEKLTQLQQKFGARLRWFSEADRGPAHAINKALTVASGDIVGWLNSDDLYAPGAINAAISLFVAAPHLLMVYGEAHHIGSVGEDLGRYPSLLPSVSLEKFQDGCFICQPSVFMRREVLETVGLLDESLATAFDFDLWLRIFKRYPGKIGFVDRVQSFSRLHDACITLNERRKVAVEGMRVLARHLGYANPRWVLSYLEERYAAYPFDQFPVDLKCESAELLREVAGYLKPDEKLWLEDQLVKDKRLQFSMPGVYVSVQPDGWALNELLIRVKQFSKSRETLQLECQHTWPVFKPITLTAVTSWGEQYTRMVKKAGRFCLDFVLPVDSVDKELEIHIHCDDSFVPLQVDASSSDQRRLCFLVKDVQMKRKYSIGDWLPCLKKTRLAEKR